MKINEKEGWENRLKLEDLPLSVWVDSGYRTTLTVHLISYH